MYTFGTAKSQNETDRRHRQAQACARGTEKRTTKRQRKSVRVLKKKNENLDDANSHFIRALIPRRRTRGCTSEKQSH